jgi:hypothetical protein
MITPSQLTGRCFHATQSSASSSSWNDRPAQGSSNSPAAASTLINRRHPRRRGMIAQHKEAQIHRPLLPRYSIIDDED